MRIYLFTKEWMQSAYVSFGDTLIFHHPHTKHVFIQLEPGKEDWNVYDSDCRLLGTLSLSTFEPTDIRCSFYLQLEEETKDPLQFYLLRPFTIGRSSKCECVIEDTYVSTHHCKIDKENKEWVIRDLDSTNGTYVNGRRIKKQDLHAGDVINVCQFMIIIGTDFIATKVSLTFDPIHIAERYHPIHEWTCPFVWLAPYVTRAMPTIPLPYKKQRAETIPYLFQIGPGITMAACSLLAMQASTGNIWLQIGILVSMVFWPLSSASYQQCKRLFERKRIRKKYGEALISYNEKKKDQLDEQSRLQQLWKRYLVEEHVRVYCEERFLYLGDQHKESEENHLADEEWDPVCRQMYEDCQKKETNTIIQPVLIKADRLIWVVGKESIAYGLYLLMQLIKQIDNNYQISLIGFESRIAFGRLRFLKAFQPIDDLFARQGDETELILCDAASFDSLLLKKENRICIVVTDKKVQMNQNGIVIDLEESRYWRHTWHSFSPYLFSIEKWNDFCVFLEMTVFQRKSLPGDFLSLFSCCDIHHMPIEQYWKKEKEHSLAAWIGWDFRGNPIMLDAHEKADGPHGIIAGTTGSGKSEFLLTYILSLSCLYSPNQVNFFLIDYKGGAMAKVLEELPHISGVMTNLEEASLQRVRQSLLRELIVRQSLFQKIMKLQDLSNLSLEQYNHYRTKQDPSLPHLFLIVDEFAQLRQDHHEFLDDLQRIARIGRSLGIHLLLCTQKPGGIIDDQIWSNARFHICFRVQDAFDSQDMLHRKDAIHLKEPGEFLMQIGNESRLLHGISAYANADYCPARCYRENLVHQLGIYDSLGKELFRHAWRSWQSSQKQLSIICHYLNHMAYGKYEIRRICLENLETYRQHMKKQMMRQIGWIDQPQQQRIIPFIIEKKTYVVLSPSLQKTKQFYENCIGSLLDDNQNEHYRISDSSDSFSLQKDRERSILLFHLEREVQHSYIWIDSLMLFQPLPDVLKRFVKLAERHTIFFSVQQLEYSLLSLLPASFVKMSIASKDKTLLSEWFHQGNLPVSNHEDCGIVFQEEAYSYICLKTRDKKIYQKPHSFFASAGWSSIGENEEGELFFWQPRGLMILLYGDPAQEEKIRSYLVAWDAARKDKETYSLFLGWGGEENTRRFVVQHRYDATLCWIGCGMEEFGYQYGFRTASCKNNEMIVRLNGTEQRIVLWDRDK